MCSWLSVLACDVVLGKLGGEGVGTEGGEKTPVPQRL